MTGAISDSAQRLPGVNAPVTPGSPADIAQRSYAAGVFTPVGGSAPAITGSSGLTASSIPTTYSPQASAAALTAQNDLAKLLMSLSDSEDEQAKKQNSSSSTASRLSTNSQHALIDYSGMQQKVEKVATEQEDAVNIQLNSGKGFGTAGVAGYTDAQVTALGTDDLIKGVNDDLLTQQRIVMATMTNGKSYDDAITNFANSIQDQEHAPGSPLYKKGSLDKVDDKLTQVSDDINSLADLAMQTTDPKVLNDLLKRSTELEVEFHRLLKEHEKLEAIARLAMQLAMGCPTAEAIRALQAMGLGALVEDMLRAFVQANRKSGKMSAGIIQVLQQCGYGSLVAYDATQQATADGKKADSEHGIATTADERLAQQAQLDRDPLAPNATPDAVAGAAQLGRTGVAITGGAPATATATSGAATARK